MAEGDTLANSLLAALITVLTTPFVPFAPVLGGAVGGYLEGGDSNDGLLVGAIAGVLALLPLLLLLLLLGNLFLFIIAAGGSGILTVFGGVGLFAIVVLILIGLFYVVLLSMIGGMVGSYVKSETTIGQ